MQFGILLFLHLHLSLMFSFQKLPVFAVQSLHFCYSWKILIDGIMKPNVMQSVVVLLLILTIPHWGFPSCSELLSTPSVCSEKNLVRNYLRFTHLWAWRRPRGFWISPRMQPTSHWVLRQYCLLVMNPLESENVIAHLVLFSVVFFYYRNNAYSWEHFGNTKNENRNKIKTMHNLTT